MLIVFLNKEVYVVPWFKRNHSMEGKIVEYGIILINDKYKIEKTEVISR